MTERFQQDSVELVGISIEENGADPQADESIGYRIRHSIEAAAGQFAANDPIATSSTSADALHDARVALRRLRSTLRTFRSLFDPGWASTVRSELGWFAGLLGAVRQVDIVVEHLSPYDEWSMNDAESDLILETLTSDRERYMRELLAASQSVRYGATLRHLETVRFNPPFTIKAADHERLALAKLLQRPWRDLRDAGRRAQKTLDEADLHAMRIRAKELRYACEIGASVFGKSLTRVAKAASEIQDRLGDHRDALFTAAYLETLAMENVEVGFLCGQLVVRERSLGEQTLQALPNDLRALRKRWGKVRWGSAPRVADV